MSLGDLFRAPKRVRWSYLVMLFIVTGGAEAAWAIVLSGHEQNHIVTPGEPMFGVNLVGLVAIGNGEPGSSTFDDIIVFQCSGALITDRHVLTASHFLDSDRDGKVDFYVRSFDYVAGFQLPDREQLIQVNTDAVHFPWSVLSSGDCCSLYIDRNDDPVPSRQRM